MKTLVKETITTTLAILLFGGIVCAVVLASKEIMFWYNFSLIFNIVILFALLFSVTQEG
jgi:hypothetical protein